MLLTKSTTFIIGPIATVLGYIMNAIFWVQDKIGIPNIGLCIILFTVVVYLLMMPLTYRQQKFSKLSAIMNPELQAIQKKYEKKKNDQVAMQAMNQETQAVYSKYGVNPMGSCLQLIIQMPILFALYRVIWNVPAYVTSVYNAFKSLAEELLTASGAEEYMTEAASSLAVTFKEFNLNYVIDTLYKFKPANWSELAEAFPSLSDLTLATQKQIDNMNYFLGLNIADSPWQIIRSSIATGSILLIIGAALVPILSAVTQWLNAKLSTVGQDNNNTNNPDNSMGNTMRTMNAIMPLMSAVFCLTLPVGMGIYWIAGAVIRSIQQVLINRHIDKEDINAIIEANAGKAAKKQAKNEKAQQQIAAAAKMNTKNIQRPEKAARPQLSEEEKSNKMKESTEYYNNTAKAKPGSLTAKAQMVQQYNERNRKK